MTMTTAEWGLAISILAFLVSGWTRVETFLNLRRQHRTDLARRLGEALVACQQTKNELADSIDQVKNFIDTSDSESHAMLEAYEATCSRMEKDYNEIWKQIQAMEAISIAFERGDRVATDPATIEARIARLNQIRLLAIYDAGYAEKQITKGHRGEI
jgi:hypothetical protein